MVKLDSFLDEFKWSRKGLLWVEEVLVWAQVSLCCKPPTTCAWYPAKTVRAAREMAISVTPPIKRVRLPSRSTRQRETTVAPTFTVPNPTVAREAKVEPQKPTASNTSVA